MDDGGDLSWWERRGQWMVVLRPTSAITSFWCVLFQRFWLHMCAFERNFSSSAELNQNLLPTIYRIYLLSSWICQSQSHRVTSCFSASEFHPWPSWASRPPMMAKHRAASLRPPKGTCPSGQRCMRTGCRIRDVFGEQDEKNPSHSWEHFMKQNAKGEDVGWNAIFTLAGDWSRLSRLIKTHEQSIEAV